ncbi:MAG TPA: tetratricopeptide repeat protein, partial [Kofleriaceae bacterium]|nr:tetratricopeptide repeat protein [Kofleriaceae bacterium]
PPVVEPNKVEAPVLPTKFVDAMEQGKQLAAKGDHARARELFETAIKLDKKKAEPHIELARLFITTGDRGPAIVAANKAVKLAPDSSQAWNTLGRAELARFSYDAAITAFHKATDLNADNVWAWNNIGFAELQLKHYQNAVDALVEATSKKGAEGYMFNNLGTALEQLDQLDDARAAFDKGGALGSKEAASSRKRLEGVKTLVVTATKLDSEPKHADAPKTYEAREQMPEVTADDAKSEVDAVQDEHDAAIQPTDDAKLETPSDKSEDGSAAKPASM